MSVKDFENKRWSGVNQVLTFRHRAALSMVYNERVLDIGSGDGLFLSMLKDRGIYGEGLDISEEAVNKSKEKGLKVSVFDIGGRINLEDKSFDVVSMLDLLEHLYSPEDTLREAVRISKKAILISVPNFNSIPARIQVLFGKVPENNRPNKGHVYWFNYKNLKNLINKSGLKIVEIKTNTFFERIPVLGQINKMLSKLFPSMFALSFMVRAEKI